MLHSRPFLSACCHLIHKEKCMIVIPDECSLAKAATVKRPCLPQLIEILPDLITNQIHHELISHHETLVNIQQAALNVLTGQLSTSLEQILSGRLKSAI